MQQAQRCTAARVQARARARARLHAEVEARLQPQRVHHLEQLQREDVLAKVVARLPRHRV